jgi:hypothetical protein
MEALDGSLVVLPIARTGAGGLREQTPPLVVPDRVGRDARPLGQF